MTQKKHLHFIGIGGIGMSGLADVYWTRGHIVTGSDQVSTPTTTRLQEKGIRVSIGHDATAVQGADWVIYSSAIAPDHIERVAAQAQGIPCLSRAQLLGDLMRSRYSIAVAGTHGKTTTSSLLAWIFCQAETSPSFVLGGVLKQAACSAAWGAGPHMVVEADESDGSLVFLHPQIAVLTNIDQDHMENYDNSFSLLINTFADFLKRLPQIDGTAILCTDDPGIQRLCTEHPVRCDVVTYGLTDAMATAANIRYDHRQRLMLWTMNQVGYSPLSMHMALVGEHNVLNAMSAVIAARLCGISDDIIMRALSTFAGVKRRFDPCGRIGTAACSADVFDDYAHHPQEIRATCAAARLRFPGRRLCAVFQPHRYSRTQALLSEFMAALLAFDVVLILPIYPAGEKPTCPDDLLYQALSDIADFPLGFCQEIALVESTLMAYMQDNDVWLLMGAGSIARVARAFMTPGHSFRMEPA